jgi:hypothetical protein
MILTGPAGRGSREYESNIGLIYILAP